MAFFFATADDLLPVLLGIEKKLKLRYTPCGHYPGPDVDAFASAGQIPTLFQPAPSESAVACPTYLVTEADSPVRARKIERNDGATVWSIDQPENEDSVVFAHGGRFGDDVLLRGEVRTVHRTPGAQKLQRAFDSALRKHFSKIRAFRVGPQAEALLDAGVRLTSAKQSPASLDLAR